MGFGLPSKLEYGTRVAAALGFVGLVSHERVGVGILRARAVEGWPPTRGRNQVVALLDFLSDVDAGGPTKLNEALGEYGLRAREPGLAVVVSDLLDPQGFEAGGGPPLLRGLRVAPLPVLPPNHPNPGFPGRPRAPDSDTSQ